MPEIGAVDRAPGDDPTIVIVRLAESAKPRRSKQSFTIERYLARPGGGAHDRQPFKLRET